MVSIGIPKVMLASRLPQYHRCLLHISKSMLASRPFLPPAACPPHNTQFVRPTFSIPTLATPLPSLAVSCYLLSLAMFCFYLLLFLTCSRSYFLFLSVIPHIDSLSCSLANSLSPLLSLALLSPGCIHSAFFSLCSS